MAVETPLPSEDQDTAYIVPSEVSYNQSQKGPHFLQYTQLELTLVLVQEWVPQS
jgi:hypothetical protein